MDSALVAKLFVFTVDCSVAGPVWQVNIKTKVIWLALKSTALKDSNAERLRVVSNYLSAWAGRAGTASGDD